MLPRWPLVAAVAIWGCGGSSSTASPIGNDAETVDAPATSVEPKAEPDASDASVETSARDSNDAALGTCNVRDFGAVADGVTNDAIAIQKAIDQCSKVIVPAGTYQIAPLF